MFFNTPAMPSADEALPGRSEPMPINNVNFINGQPIAGPFAEGLESAYFAMGFFLVPYFGSFGSYILPPPSAEVVIQTASKRKYAINHFI